MEYMPARQSKQRGFTPLETTNPSRKVQRLDRSVAGFTLVELLIVIVVIGILASLVLNNIQGAQGKARDSQRVTDISNLSSKLEEYHNDNGGYPNTFTAATLPGIDPEALKDPLGNSITINAPVSDQVAAVAVAAPTATGASYKYIPYPTGCLATTCTGYVLKSYIEKPTATTLNPYVKKGINNN